jgi:hypothetical protein
MAPLFIDGVGAMRALSAPMKLNRTIVLRSMTDRLREWTDWSMRLLLQAC